MRQIQQGDVLLIEAQIPPSATERRPGTRGHVLAEGEATGHAHTIAPGGVRLYEFGGAIYLRVEGSPAVVRHEEHGAVEVPVGTWEVGRVVEVDPFTAEIRGVSD